jgi:hypothetical protein
MKTLLTLGILVLLPLLSAAQHETGPWSNWMQIDQGLDVRIRSLGHDEMQFEIRNVSQPARWVESAEFLLITRLRDGSFAAVPGAARLLAPSASLTCSGPGRLFVALEVVQVTWA